jgi:hypothetical protein
MNLFESLPSEIIHEILLFLNSRVMFELHSVNKHFNLLLSKSDIWKQYIQTHFSEICLTIDKMQKPDHKWKRMGKLTACGTSVTHKKRRYYLANSRPLSSFLTFVKKKSGYIGMELNILLYAHDNKYEYYSVKCMSYFGNCCCTLNIYDSKHSLIATHISREKNLSMIDVFIILNILYPYNISIKD